MVQKFRAFWADRRLMKRAAHLLCPVMFSTYPVFFLYTHNIEILSLGQLVAPLLFASVLACVFFGLWQLLLKNSLMASLATTGFLLLFWNFDFIFQCVNQLFSVPHGYVVLLLFVLYGGAVYGVHALNKKRNLEEAGKALLLMGAFLILYNLVCMVPAEIEKHRLTLDQPGPELKNEPQARHGNYPDIYLIILDEYASLATIKDEWGYNNDGLASFLVTNGFFVARNSEHRYSQTLQNIASLLNLNYLTGPVEKNDYLDFIYKADGAKKRTSYQMLKKQAGDSRSIQMMNDNFLVRYLKNLGYNIVVLEGISQHYTTFNIRAADSTFSYQEGVGDKPHRLINDPFNFMLLRKSMVARAVGLIKRFSSPYINYVGTKHVFSILKKDIFDSQGPKFVYAHIECPHKPFVFDRNGGYVSSNPFRSPQREGKFVVPNDPVNKAYMEQYIYVTNELKAIIRGDAWKDSASNAVMIIQNDHGPRPHGIYLQDRTQSFKAFNAVHFPDGDYTGLYDTIAPVNTLRVVLNKYFGEHFKMLEER